MLASTAYRFPFFRVRMMILPATSHSPLILVDTTILCMSNRLSRWGLPRSSCSVCIVLLLVRRDNARSWGLLRTLPFPGSSSRCPRDAGNTCRDHPGIRSSFYRVSRSVLEFCLFSFVESGNVAHVPGYSANLCYIVRSAFRAHGRTAFRAVCQGLRDIMAAMAMIVRAHLRYLISLVAGRADAGIVVEDEETTGAFVAGHGCNSPFQFNLNVVSITSGKTLILIGMQSSPNFSTNDPTILSEVKSGSAAYFVSISCQNCIISGS